MPHTFPLAAVLAIRQQKEETEERALGIAAAQVLETRTAIAQLQTALRDHADTRAKEALATNFAVHHQAQQARWMGLCARLTQLHEQLNLLEAKRTEQQGRYLAARRVREMLTELRQQARAAWLAESESREQKHIDDLFTARRRGY